MSTALRWLSLLSVGTLLLAARAQAAPTATPTATKAPTATPTATTFATPTSEPATLEVRVTDAPPKGVTKILITVEDIEANVAGDAADSGWRTIIKGPLSFDLVELTGVEEVLGESELEPGRYGQLRVTVVDASITIQGEEKAATVPSGKLRFVGGFDLVAGETTMLTLDFDAKKSVILRGKMDPLLRPVVKLLVRQGDEEVTDAVVVSDIVDGGDTPPTPGPTGPTPSPIAIVTEPPIQTPSPTPTATVRPAATPTPTPTPTPIPTYNLVAKVTSEDGGYFAGAAASDFSLVAITGYATTTEGIDADERNLTFFDADGNLLAKVDIGGGSWGVAMTPDGSKTVAGSDDEQLYVFEGTTLVASGRPIGGNGQLRGMAISADGQYAVVGGFAASVHDLTAADPITPIFIDDTTDQLRGVDITPDGRYAAYGGRYGGNNMYMAISDDGKRVVAGDWGGFVHYYVRP